MTKLIQLIKIKKRTSKLRRKIKAWSKFYGYFSVLITIFYNCHQEVLKSAQVSSTKIGPLIKKVNFRTTSFSTDGCSFATSQNFQRYCSFKNI